MKTTHKLLDVLYKDFLDYYHQFNAIADRAFSLFTAGMLNERLQDDLSRVKLYRSAILKSVDKATSMLGKDTYKRKIWKRMRKRFNGKYDDRLAATYFTSVMRKVFAQRGIPIEFNNDGIDSSTVKTGKTVKRYELNNIGCIGEGIISALYDSVFSGYLSVDIFQEIEIIDAIISDQIDSELSFYSLEILSPVFYRGKGAYLIGHLSSDSASVPVVICLIHTITGINTDAILIGHKKTRNFLFSSTRSAFTVSTHNFQQIFSYIQKLFPKENPAYIFDLLGYTHPAKISLLQQLRKILKDGKQFQYIGTGPVDIVFGIEGFPLIFKILRSGVPDKRSIIDNFLKVHEIDRLGQILDSVDYHNTNFKGSDFSVELTQILKNEKPDDLIINSDSFFMKQVYASRRIKKVPEVLRTVDKEETERILLGVGWNIKHLAAMGFLPRALGLEHFGYTNWGRVVYLNNATLIDIRLFLFSYPVKTNLGIERYSANPATFEKDLNIPFLHRDIFRAVHGDLFFPQFWESMKEKVHKGQIPDIYPYPARFRLRSRKFYASITSELKRLNDSKHGKQIHIMLDNLAVLDIELAGLSFLRLEVPNPNARVLVIEPIGPDIIAQLHLRFHDVTFDILKSESEIVENAGQWSPGIHGKLQTLVQVRRYDYVIGYVNETFDETFFKTAKLKGFLLLSTGIHNIDIEAATQCHTVVTNAPGPTTTTVSEQNIGLMLDALYSHAMCFKETTNQCLSLALTSNQKTAPRNIAQIMWLMLLHRTLKLNEMFAFGTSLQYVRTGIGKHATVYHEQLGQDKEAGIFRSIGVIGLNETGLNLIEIAISHEISSIYVLEREYWDLSSDQRDRLEEMIAIIKQISQTNQIGIRIIPANSSALIHNSNHLFNADPNTSIQFIADKHHKRSDIDINDIFIRDSSHLITQTALTLTLGIQGFGRIGEAVAQRALSLGISILIYQRDPERPKYQSKQRNLARLADHCSVSLRCKLNIQFAKDKDDFFRKSNIITTLAATTEKTKGWVDADGLEMFASQASSPVKVIVNAGKGLVDERALINFLSTNPDAEARLDVLIGEHEGNAYQRLLSNNLPLTNLKITGHTAAAVREVRQLKIYKALNNLRNLIDGRIPPNIINNPITVDKCTPDQTVAEIAGLKFLHMSAPAPVARVLIIEPFSPDLVLHLQKYFGDTSFDLLLAESELLQADDRWIPGINHKLNLIVSNQHYDYCLGYCNADFDRAFFEQAMLKGLILFSTATHHIDINAATEVGTLITNAPGFTTVAVTEQNIGMALDALYGRIIREQNSSDSISLANLTISSNDQARTIAHILWFVLLRQTLRLDDMYEFGAGDKYVRTGIRQDATVYHDQLGQYDQAEINNSIGIIGLDEVGINLIELAIAHEISVIYVLKNEYKTLPKKAMSIMDEYLEILHDLTQTEPFSVQIHPVDIKELSSKATYIIKTPSAYNNHSITDYPSNAKAEVFADAVHVANTAIFSHPLHGLTFGVQGLGRIGQAVVQRALAFGANIIVCQRDPERPQYQQKLQKLKRLANNRARAYGHDIDVTYVNKEQLFRKSNIVTTLAATTKTTRYWVDHEALNWFGSDNPCPIKILVNSGKGLVNETDLIQFLRENPDVEVRLDVISDEQEGKPSQRFTDTFGRLLPNLKISGHTAAAVPELRRLKIIHALNNLRLLIDGKTPYNIVNEEAFTSLTTT